MSARHHATKDLSYVTTFAEAAAAMDIPVDGNVDSIVVKIDPDTGKPRNKRLAAIADRSIDGQVDVYVASGGFQRGKVTVSYGRKKENAREIYFLGFDCDLADFLEMDKDAVYAMTSGEIEQHLPGLVNWASDAVASAGLPVTAIDYTGHGILVRVHLRGDTSRVLEIDAAYKVLIKRINAAAGFRLVDAQASDAGSRIFRLVGTLNGKCLPFGQPARQTRTLEQPGELLDVDLLLELAGADRKRQQPTPLVARHGKPLPDADADAIVEAVAPSWKLGQKHALSLALGGMLAKAGVPEPQALAIVERLSANDKKPWDRAKSVSSSYARYRAGSDVRGYFALQEFVPADVAEYVDGILDRFRQSHKPGPVLREGSGSARRARSEREAARGATFEADPPPASAFYGWLGDYHGIVAPTTEAADAFHLGAGLVLVGAMMGRRVRTRHASEHLYGNLYVVEIGPSGSSRKDTAVKRALSLPQLQRSLDSVVPPGFGIARDVSSAEGLISILKDQPNTLLYLTELSTLLSNARRKSTSTILNRLIEAWDTPHVLQNLNKLSPQSAIDPYLSIIACTQPGRFANEITDEDIHSGFANRWLFMPGTGKEPIATPPDMNETAAWDLYYSLWQMINTYPVGAVVLPDAGARAVWSEWYEASVRQRGGDEEEDAMRIRHGLLIHKIALIYAVTDGAREIGRRHIEPAIALIDWMWSQVRRLMREWGVTKDIKLENRIFTTLEQRGALTRRDLQRRVGGRQWSAREFAMSVDSMLKNGTIAFDPASQKLGIPIDLAADTETGAEDELSA